MAFSYAGLVTGIFATIATALVCTHCAYILVKCAHTLYQRTRRTTMSFSEVAEVAFLNGELNKRLQNLRKECQKIIILIKIYRSSLGTTMVAVHEAFHQLWTIYHLLWYLLSIHRHHSRKLPANCTALHRL